MGSSEHVAAYIPTYYRNELLFGRSLASVLRQTRPVDQILIVADGMAGEELEDLGNRVLELNDSRISVWNLPHQDYGDDPGVKWSIQALNSRNWALDHALPGWVAPLDDDDEWTDDHVEVLLDAALRDEADFAYGMADTPHGQRYGHWPPSGMNFTDGSQLYRHDMGYRYDSECLTRWLPSDADLWNRMVAGGVKFTFVGQIVHHYFPAPR